MSEAKKWNPKVRTYVLSWGVPGWVGNGSYFSPANIQYQTNFVKGARDVYNISVDYLGICGRTDPHSPLPPAAPRLLFSLPVPPCLLQPSLPSILPL